MLEAAKKYALSLLLQSEEVNIFPKDFVSAAIRWVNSWFLVDDPVAEAIVGLPGNEEAKAKIVETKLPKLLENPKFLEELKIQLGELERQKTRVKNLVDGTSEIEAEGSVTVGDKGIVEDDNYIQKNIVKGKIKAGQDVNIGDTYHQKGDNFSIVNNYFQHLPMDAPVPIAALIGLKKELHNHVSKGNIGEAIDKLVGLSGQTKDFQNTIIQLSGRWAELRRQKKKGVLSTSEANLERARIDVALLELIEEIPG